MDVLTPIEKLVLLRKKYKINQKDLAGEKVSRSHLAMIETGKNAFNNHTAVILVENLNNILKERGIDEVIRLEDLMETKEMQVEKLKNSFLEKLEDKENLEETVSEIESYASEYDSNTKIILYKKMADLFYENGNLHRATSFYLRIVNDLIIKGDSASLGEVSVTLIRIYIKIENYKDAVDLENLIKSEIINFSMSKKAIILYNLGVVYERLNLNDKALKYFIEVESLIKDTERLFDIKFSQALSLADLGRTSEAISIFRSLMLKYEEIEKKLMINDNLLYISKLDNNLEKVKFYYRKCKNIIKNNDFENKNHLFSLEQIEFSLGETALSLNKNKDAKLFFISLCKEKTDQNNKIKFKAIKHLLTLLNKKDLELVSYLENTYFSILKREINLGIGFDFLSFYIKFNLEEKQNEFLKNIKQFY